MHSARLNMRVLVLLVAFSLFVAGIVFRVEAAEGFGITAPEAGTLVKEETITLRFSLPDNFRVVDYRTHPQNRTNQGHIHLWVDQDTLTTENAIHVVGAEYVLENLKSGTHTVVAELVANNHTPLTPPTRSELSFTSEVQIPQPAPSPFAMPVLQSALVAAVLTSLALYFVSQQLQTFSSTNTPPTKKKTPSTSRKSKSKSKSKSK